jgi:KDO2-lipid IV(A) lauroyltransferase
MRAFLIKILLQFLALFPLKTIHSFAALLGQTIAKKSQLRLTQVARTNIGLCFPQLSNEAQDVLIKASLIETCKTFSELGALWLWKVDKVLELVQEVSGELCLQQALERGKGVLLLTPHLGAWELAGLYASSRYKLTGLYRPPKLLGLEKLIRNARERAGGQFVATDQSGIRALYQSLRRGQIVGILPDQVPNEVGSGVFAPFFKLATYTMVLVPRFARKSGATVIFTYAERLPQGRGFHLHFFPASNDIAANDMKIAAAALNKGVEQCVKACPEQYQWSYKRFKRLPEGDASVYE